MKFVIKHHLTGPPHYELMFENGETLKIHEDFFFDLISGCAVEYEKGTGKIADRTSADTEVADQGEYSRESDTRLTLQGEKIRGVLVIDPDSKTISIIQN